MGLRLTWGLLFVLGAAGPTHAALCSSEATQVCVDAGLDSGLTVRVGEVLSARGGVFIQGRFDGGMRDGTVTRADFSFRLVRPVLNLSVVRPWLRFNLTPEFAGTNASLWTAFVEAQPWTWLGLRAGQFLTNHTRTIAVQFPLRQWTDPSGSTTAFGVPRDIGAVVFGQAPRGLLDWQLGVYNGTGANRVAVGHVPSVLVARLALNPLRPMPYTETPGVDGPVPPGFALAGHATVRTHNNPLAPREPLPTDIAGAGVGFDAALHWDNVAVQGELIYRVNVPGLQDLTDLRRCGNGTTCDVAAWRTTPKAHGVGGNFQASAFVVPRYLELGARLGGWSTNVAGGAWVTTYDAQATGYVLGNHVKVVGRYGLLARHRTWSTQSVEQLLVVMLQLFL